MANLVNIDVGSLAKSIAGPIEAAIKKGENLANIEKEVAAQLQGFLTDVNKGQVELNKIDAQSPSLFKSGWRPALAWIAVAGFFWGYIVYPITVFFLKIFEIKQDLPTINSDGLFELVLALLGMAGIREFGKVKGTTK
jgi:hypothetical protein